MTSTSSQVGSKAGCSLDDRFAGLACLLKGFRCEGCPSEAFLPHDGKAQLTLSQNELAARDEPDGVIKLVDDFSHPDYLP
jgi:hypothetical protein